MNAVIVISPADNVATALDALEPGCVLADAGGVTVRDAIPRGHKIALRPIPAGSAVVKYGSSIGTATADIPPGAHVHTHNLASGRGRGDLAAEAAPPAPPRLAEPVDNGSGA
jgi:altronate hydrolase